MLTAVLAVAVVVLAVGLVAEIQARRRLDTTCANVVDALFERIAHLERHAVGVEASISDVATAVSFLAWRLAENGCIGADDVATDSDVETIN